MATFLTTLQRRKPFSITVTTSAAHLTFTDDKANITQYDAYLPYGELLVDEHRLLVDGLVQLQVLVLVQKEVQ